MQTQTEQMEVIESFEKGLTKSDIKNLSEEFVEKVLAEGNPLKAAEGLSAMESFIKEVKDNSQFKAYVREEAAQYPKGFVSNSGAKIECCETGTKYNYDTCGDPIYGMYSQKLLSAQNSLKEREAFLKTIPSEGLEIRFDDELIRVFPPSKSSTSSYKITLQK